MKTKEQLAAVFAEINRSAPKLPEGAAALAFEAQSNGASGPAVSWSACWKGWKMEERLALEAEVRRFVGVLKKSGYENEELERLLEELS